VACVQQVFPRHASLGAARPLANRLRKLGQNMVSGMDLAEQVAVVTGASMGIGRATALALGKAGAKVVVNYRSHRELAEEVVAEIRDSGSEAISVEADVADQAAVERLVEAAVGNFGKLNIAVSNAAYSEREPFHSADMVKFRRTIDVTMWGAFYLVRAAAQRMIEQQTGGAIAVVSSPHAFVPVPNSMAYNMAKAALDHMARTAAIELAGHKIRINVIQPGWTDTPGERKFASEETLQRAAESIPAGRLGTAEEMAQGILFLCDPANTYITGATLLIDGGITLPWWANRGSAAPA